MGKKITIQGLVGLLTVFLGSCAVTTKVIPPVTGSPMTAEWVEYNRQAEVKGAPLLMYAATVKELSGAAVREPRGIQDMFSLEDGYVYVYTKWTSVKGKPKYHATIYDPRGSVFHESEVEYRFGSGSWNMWTSLHIKGWPASRLPGKWRVEIFMNDSLALRKEFVIGSEVHRYEPRVFAKDELTIGVHPYFIGGDVSRRDHATQLPLYISQMLLVDCDKCRLVTPFHLRTLMPKPVVGINDYGNLIRQEIHAADSPWNDVAKRFNLDVLIAGGVVDSNIYEVRNQATIYLVSLKSQSIQEIKVSYTPREAFDAWGLTENFYREIYDHILTQGVETLGLKR